MNRREFLDAMAGAAGHVAALTAVAWARGAEAACGAGSGGSDPWQEAFHAALAERPWLLGYKSFDREVVPPRAARLEGRIPERLSGTLYRNGPARHEVGGYRYRHWLDGDGLVQAWRIANGKVEHRARMVRTFKYDKERAEGRALYPAFGSIPPGACPVSGPDDINAANISVLPRGDELWALWEAGSAWRLDPVTLETKGVQTFSQHTRSAPFSAHPRLDPDGTLWNFGYASDAGVMVFWHLDPGGVLKRAAALPVEPMTMPHDFVVTRRHIVLLLPPLDFSREAGAEASFLDSHSWRPDRPTRVLVLDKRDLDTHFWLELPAEWAFHFGNAWEDDSGVIRFDGSRADAPDVLYGRLRNIMKGEDPDPSESTGRHVLYRIDTKRRRAELEPLGPAGLATEFPVVDPRRSTSRHEWVTVLAADAPPKDGGPVHGSFDSVARLNVESGLAARYAYPDHLIPEEHVFVPDPAGGGETDGWLLGTALDWRARSTVLNVFEVGMLEAGPVAAATIPEPMPLGLHGRFQPGAAGW